MRRSYAFLMLAFAALLALPAIAEDAPKTKKIANPEYDNWAQFQVGAFVELTTESEAMGQKSTMTATTKLLELTKEKAVIETNMGIEGVPAMRRDVPKEIEVPDVKGPDSPTPDVKIKEGEETIDVAGTSMKCKTIESTAVTGDMTATSKTWMSEQIPGRIAKMDVVSSGKIGDMEIKSTAKSTITKWSPK
jgi:hypothetical protein